MTKKNPQRPFVVAALVSVAVFAAGFFALNLFWLCDFKSPDLPGLYDYYAATWGDGLFLPIGAGALAFYLCNNKDMIGGKHFVGAAIASIVGGLLGAVTQASWLANPDIAPNWTIPEAGHFAPSGWYHAAFFVLASAFYCGSLLLFLLVKLKKRNRDYLATGAGAETLIWIAAFGYLSMHLIDDYSSYPAISVAFLFLLVGCAAAGAFCLLMGARQRHFLWEFCCFLPGILLGVGVLVFVRTSSFSLLAEAVYGLSFVAIMLTAFIPSTSESKARMVFRLFAMIPVLTGLALATLGVTSLAMTDATIWYWYCFLALCFVLFALYVVASNNYAGSPKKTYRKSLIVALIAALYTLFLSQPADIEAVFEIAIGGFSFSQELSTGELITNALLFSVLVSLCVWHAKSFVQYLKEIEDDGANRSKETIQRIQVMFYIQLALMAIGLLVFLLLSKLSLSLFDASFWRLLAPSFNEERVYLLWGALVFLCMALWMLMRKRAKSVGIGLFSLALIVGIYAGIIVSAGHARVPVVMDWWSFFALFVCIGAPLLVGESFLSNCVLLRGRELSYYDVALASLIAVGCALLSMSVVLPTLGAGSMFLPTIVSPGISALAILFSYVIVPVICATRYNDVQDEKQQLVFNTPVAGVLQNGVAATVVVVFLGVFPLEIYLANASLFMAILMIALLVVLKIPRFCFPLEKNAEFLQERIEDVECNKVASKEEALNELSALSLHFQRQALITSFALLPWSVAMVCAYAVKGKGYLRTRINVDGVLKRAWDKLLLRPISKETFKLFYDLMPEGRHKHKSDIRKLADEGIATMKK